MHIYLYICHSFLVFSEDNSTELLSSKQYNEDALLSCNLLFLNVLAYSYSLNKDKSFVYQMKINTLIQYYLNAFLYLFTILVFIIRSSFN